MARALETIGNYRLGAMLAEGGMATVYVGHHTLIDRAVAIKVLTAETDQGALVRRFLDEAHALAAARGAGVVDLLDCGLLDDGRPFMILELLRGETLGRRLRDRGRCSVAEAIEVAASVARILETIHVRDIVHRDLTPDNVFLTSDPPRPGVKLLDFGIAKMPGPLRDPGLVVGTPAYMAPEQCLDPDAVDHRADLYALGCVLFEMVAGYPPFGGDSPEEILSAHERATAPRLRDHVAAVSDELDAVVAALLCKRPQDRIPSALDLALLLEASAPRGDAPGHAASASRSVRAPQLPPEPHGLAPRTQSVPWPWWCVRTFVAVAMLGWPA